MDPTPTPLTADERFTLILAAVVAASLCTGFDDREFNGMRSPRCEAAMARSLDIARTLMRRYRRSLDPA